THLTSSKGVELFAKFSPDGRWIAFTGQIDGDEQVYVMPAEGGEPRQLTWYPAHGPLPDRWGYDHQVYGWTPDGSAVLFRSLDQAWTMTGCRLYTVAVGGAQKQRGALPVPLPMPQSGAGDFSPDGRLIVYAPLFRDFRTEKRYEGGWAPDLFVFDPQTGTAENITNDPRTDRDPMWIGERIWFASDRTGTLNLWSYDPKTRKVFQETSSERWDVRWPSAGGPGEERIVYELAGELCWFDCRTHKEHPISIKVPDEALLRRPSLVDASSHIEDFDLAPNGKRAVLSARGEVLSLPLEHGDVRNLTRSPGAHDKHAAWSPDGSKIAFVSDRSGEEQIYVVDHLGKSEPEQLTSGLKVMLLPPVWAPDGKKLAFSDKDGVLRVLEVATKALTVVADEPHGQIGDQTWSPCSSWLAFSMTGDNELSGLYLWSSSEQKLHRVSRPLADDAAPAFDAKGERLFFLGLRGFEPRLASTYEWDFQIDRSRGIFALALRKELGPLFGPRSDEAVAEAKPADATAGKDTAGKDASREPAKDAGKDAKPVAKELPPIAIDFDGIHDRVETVPVPFDNYAGLAAVDGGLVYLRQGAGYYGRDPDHPTTLHLFAFDKREASELGADVHGFAVAAGGKKLLVHDGAKWFVLDVPPGGKDGKKELKTGGLLVERVPADEWQQIFQEVWRRYRDFFYVDNMHGYDWEALREQYAPLVAHVRHRSDLNYVIGEMIAELAVGHAYISGGDIDRPARVRVALPGALFQFDPQNGRYQIARILRGENDDPVYRSPMTAVGVQAHEGDYVLAIDGQELTAELSPYQLLRGKADRQVSLTLNSKPLRDGAREVLFTGIADEQKLHYLAWLTSNRERIGKLGGGKLGYLHLPDMGADGIREFIKQYYSQRDKEGLIVDDRCNGGGNVSQMVINRLSRKLLMCTFGRTTGLTLYPRATFHGHLVCLLNETSASDGDIFPAMFRAAGLGKLIGKRSWGGIVGITNRGPLLDGGTVNVPEFGNTEPGPQWTIEGHGVDPDIVVDNDPQSVLQGRDPQLEKAVEVLLERIAKQPLPRPVRPPAPIKTGH
ncbi:MAG TPA: S41 family peptidase, partial [Planctomycetota bacterium]|nr:S41 family peptidase [Planctomycetota bacterium]